MLGALDDAPDDASTSSSSALAAGLMLSISIHSLQAGFLHSFIPCQAVILTSTLHCACLPPDTNHARKRLSCISLVKASRKKAPQKKASHKTSWSVNHIVHLAEHSDVQFYFKVGLPAVLRATSSVCIHADLACLCSTTLLGTY